VQEKLIQLLHQHLDMLYKDASLFDLGTTIGIITSSFLNEEDGWDENDLIFGVEHGFGWKTGTSDKILERYKDHLKSKELMKNLDRLEKLTEERKQLEKQLTSCQADSDGECNHPLCPQIRDGEPEKTGRSCPLWTQHEDY
jgi:hypothetical protein